MEHGRFGPCSLFFICFLIVEKSVLMYVDVRNRTSNSPVKIPCKYQAFLFQFSTVDGYDYKIVIAADYIHASQYIKDWCFRESVDIFFRFVGMVDYEVAGIADDKYYLNLFNDVP